MNHGHLWSLLNQKHNGGMVSTNKVCGSALSIFFTNYYLQKSNPARFY